MSEVEKIKTGIRGVGYIRLNDSVAWPESLEKPFPRPTVPDSRNTAEAAVKAA